MEFTLVTITGSKVETKTLDLDEIYGEGSDK